MNHSLPQMLETGGNFDATVENDPIFTPLFTAIGFSSASLIAGTSISAASIASAVSAGGGYLEF